MKSIELRAALAAAALSLLAPSLVVPANALGTGPAWVWPVTGTVITQYRNGSDPYAGGQHRGIDIAAPVGTPVLAATGGTVAYAGVAGSSGLTVAVRNADGRLETTYLHLASIGVRAGDAVSTGDRLGAVGTTGRRSAVEPHLHFGVRDAGDRFGYHDPLDFLPPPPAPPGLRVPDPVAIPVASPAAPDPVPVQPAAVPTPAFGVAPRISTAPVPRRVTAPSPAAPVMGVDTARAVHPYVPHGHAGPHPAATPPHASGRAHHTLAPAPTAGPRASAGPHARLASVAGSGASATARDSVRAAVRRGRAGRGLDAGWLAACGGLVLAAVVLGSPKGPGRAGRECRRLLAGTVSQKRLAGG